MNSKKVLALMMGTIIASSVTSQTVVQVYAHDEESSSSSYSDDYLGDISFLDEEESSGGAEPMEDSPAVEELEKLTNFKNERTKDVMSYRHGYFDLLYVSTSNLIFELTSDTEVGLACLDAESEFNGNVVVPERVSINGKIYSVTSIGSSAFYKCRNLENITLPASINRIGSCAFAFCKNLQLEELPEDLEIIGALAFASCENLRLISLPNGLRQICKYAFINCRNLQLETLPEGLEIIGREAFKDCTNLKLKALPANLHEIGEGAFYGCGEIELKKLPEGIETIGRETFRNCSNLQLEKLPANLCEIGNKAFAYCENLQLETLPEGLEIIGKNAFAGTGIRTITIPASVTELGDSAFDTDSIEEIILAERSRLNDGDIRRAYGGQLERVLGPEVAQEQIVGQEIITPVELNAEVARDVCPICYSEFNEGEGAVGILLCGHHMHLECFNEQVRNYFEQNVPFKCPICRREYNIF